MSLSGHDTFASNGSSSDLDEDKSDLVIEAEADIYSPESKSSVYSSPSLEGSSRANFKELLDKFKDSDMAPFSATSSDELKELLKKLNKSRAAYKGKITTIKTK